MLILTETTPNPEAMKFTPQERLTEGVSRSFRREGFDAGASPLAARLFALAGVEGVHIAPDFVTVTRARGGPAWPALKAEVVLALDDHLQDGAPALSPTTAEAPSPDAVGVDQIEDEIRSVLGLYVKSGVARDGGEVLFDRFDPETGVLWVAMHGACGGCPSSRLTLKAGVERIVRRYVPEVLRVEEAVPPAPAATKRMSPLARWSGAKAGGGARPRFTFGGEGPAGGRKQA